MDDGHAAIAVIGIGCRFPAAAGPAAFWQLLSGCVDAVTDVPSDRWDVDAVFDPVPATPGKMCTRRGGFLDQITDFDPAFFGISGREAERMDPQQRLLLEVAWEALEHAGLPPDSLTDSVTGVFVGISNCDYARLAYRGLESLNAYSATGTSLAVAANRISYVLNLRGPSLAVDTACSSALVAAHLACQSLRSGESELALVGGVNLVLTPEGTVTFSQARVIAPDGRCKSFDAAADGYVRGEGCGVVVLQRLADAQRQQRRILAVIHGSAVNQDGLTNGLTAPNGPSQREVIGAAVRDAGVKPSDIEFVEAHGTGTPLGDTIEVRALKEALMEGRRADQLLRLGSVKPNIGHLEAASGIASLIKTVLSLVHGSIPPVLHFQKLNPYIDLKGVPCEIPVRLTDWIAPPGKRLAGVNSFGFGGTNCHIIVGDAPVQPSIAAHAADARSASAHPRAQRATLCPWPRWQDATRPACSNPKLIRPTSAFRPIRAGRNSSYAAP